MRTPSSHAPAKEFLDMARVIGLLQEQGIPDDALDALIREKVLSDVVEEKAKRREPSLN